MNSLYNKNLELFSRRFPEMYAVLESNLGVLADFSLVQRLPAFKISPSHSGLPTASDNGIQLHSAYNPQKEAEKHIELSCNAQQTGAVFFSFGLGYAPDYYAQKFPSSLLILIEPNPLFVLAAFTAYDWSRILAHPQCVFLIDAPQQVTISILEKAGIKKLAFVHNRAQKAHAEDTFKNLETLIERNIQKDQINQRTLEKFSHLWLKNMCKNLSAIKTLSGVQQFANKGQNLSACVLAAGPSLDTVLPFLQDIHQRTITICVDTALRACLGAGVQPDFIIVVDPQYWNMRHIAGLSSPSSILITEAAVYPPVLRFKARQTVLCSSLYPLGKFIEQHTEAKGSLGAGGSVATTAWDFARLLGCQHIYLAGLDLSFPGNKTHFKGSTFEEAAHMQSKRLSPAEISSYHALYGANPFYAADYYGNKLLTDSRMSLYAWWFESKCAANPQQQSFTLTPQGLAIPGIKPLGIEEVLRLADCQSQKAELFAQTALSPDNSAKTAQSGRQFDEAILLALEGLQDIRFSAEKALLLCQEGLRLCQPDMQIKKNDQRLFEILQLLQKIDHTILKNKSADLASLVFPTEQQLERATAHLTHPLQISSYVYTQLAASTSTHIELLRNFFLTTD